MTTTATQIFAELAATARKATKAKSPPKDLAKLARDPLVRTYATTIIRALRAVYTTPDDKLTRISSELDRLAVAMRSNKKLTGDMLRVIVATVWAYDLTTGQASDKLRYPAARTSKTSLISEALRRPRKLIESAQASSAIGAKPAAASRETKAMQASSAIGAKPAAASRETKAMQAKRRNNPEAKLMLDARQKEQVKGAVTALKAVKYSRAPNPKDSVAHHGNRRTDLSKILTQLGNKKAFTKQALAHILFNLRGHGKPATYLQKSRAELLKGIEQDVRDAIFSDQRTDVNSGITPW